MNFVEYDQLDFLHKQRVLSRDDIQLLRGGDYYVGTRQLLLAKLDISRHFPGLELLELLRELLNQLIGQCLHGGNVDNLEASVETLNDIKDSEGGDVSLTSTRWCTYQHIFAGIVGVLEHFALNNV